MPPETAPGLTTPLPALLRAVEPAAVMVPDHLLRRVIRKVDLDGSHPLHVPHPQSCWVNRVALLAATDDDDFGQALPEMVLLLPESLTDVPGGPAAMLRAAWRSLFHAAVDRAIDRLALSPADARQRGLRLGWTAFQEARTVLDSEHLLLVPTDDRVVWREFVATFLELNSFAPDQLLAWFPGLNDVPAVLRLIREDVDADALLTTTRLEGATLPEPSIADAEKLLGLSGPCDALEATETTTDRPGRIRSLMARAKLAAARGNDVRTIIARQRILDLGTDRADEVRAALSADLDRLAQRLRAALHLDELRAVEWRQLLSKVVGPAACGRWSVAARLLYDLQKICVDTERDLFAVDLVEWVISGFARPIKRRLTCPRSVNVVRHLRTAYHRLSRVPLPPEARIRWATLLKLAAHHAEERLRDEFRPILNSVLDRVGLVPTNRVEQVGRDKLIEELLDKLGERGFLVMSDVRDAVARNQPRLHDLPSVKTFITGDELIRANRLLARELDGVYRRGEIYLRGMQRLGALAFGTPWGRWLTLFVILPFGGALMTLKFAEYMIDEGAALVRFVTHPAATPAPPNGTPAVSPNLPTDPAAIPDELDDESSPAAAPETVQPAHRHAHVHFTSWPAVLTLGVFLLLLLHLPAARRSAYHAVRAVGRGLLFVFIQLPVYFLSLSVVRFLMDNLAVRVFRRYLLAPVLIALPLALLERRWFRSPVAWRTSVVLDFLLLVVVCNIRPIREALARFGEELMRTWKLATTAMLAAVAAAILEAFAWLVEQVERTIYAGDEWLRFRQGEGRFTFAAKLVLGLIWSFVTYVVRFVVVLLFEPQVNPLKHFPVVTVSHKLLFPMILPEGKHLPSPAGQILISLFGTPVRKANIIAGSVVWCVPGIFGFLAWELMTNWRLYRANRPRNLRPAIIGSHGEKMTGLLRPGFHSGTVPKLYRHLRRADGRAVARYGLKLEHVEEAVRHFFEREFLAYLHGSRRWGGLKAELAEVELTVNRIAVTLAAAPTGRPPLVLAFEEHAGRLLARIDQIGWLEVLSPEQRQAFADALAGLYQRAGVDLVQEQLAELYGPGVFICNGNEDMLVIGRPDGETSEVVLASPGSEKSPLLLSGRPIPWDRWVAVWEDDRAGKIHGGELLPVS